MNEDAVPNVKATLRIATVVNERADLGAPRGRTREGIRG